MYGPGMNDWAPLSEVAELKKVAQEIAEEESRASSVLSTIGADGQTFSSDMYKDELISQRNALNNIINDQEKEFINDDGIRHVWDTETNGWVVAEKEGEDNLAKGDGESDEKSMETSEFLKELNDGNNTSSGAATDEKPEKRKRNKKKKKNIEWSASSNLWVYVDKLPLDITVEEIKAHFSKVGLIALNPVDQLPKIKMYTDESGNAKGDCSICYNAESSADMALEVLDGGYIRPSSNPISVMRAEFQKRSAPSGQSDEPVKKKPTLTHAQIKVSQNAMAQALAWNEDDDVGVSKAKALKIVVIENMFDPRQVDAKYKGQDSIFFEELEKDIASEGEKCGQIDKITIFSRSPQGAVIIKYCTSYAAQECVRMFDGRMYDGKKLRCKFWDGVVDYTAVSIPSYEEQEAGVSSEGDKVDVEESRLDAFGDWLDNEQEDLPEEFRLRVE